mmetsp:Transcript_23489/g.41974  ORF Transcript_23489/g.41974 Transcript_23489/m.41974 type:complete len:130 (-) Transcript_23489:321-710(-)
MIQGRTITHRCLQCLLSIGNVRRPHAGSDFESGVPTSVQHDGEASKVPGSVAPKAVPEKPPSSLGETKDRQDRLASPSKEELEAAMAKSAELVETWAQSAAQEEPPCGTPRARSACGQSFRSAAQGPQW